MTRPVPLRPRSASADVRKPVSHGASGRVADVHGQTRRGLLVAAAFMAAAVLAGLTRIGTGWWLPLHLFVVGGLLSAVSATTQMLAVSWSAARAPRRLVAGSQRWALAVGMSIGIVLGTGWAGRSFVELRDVHLVLNVFGLIGLVIAGTLPYFVATQVRSKMSPRATPTAMRVTFAVLAAATAVAATGHLMDRPGVAAAGLIAYASALLVIAASLPIYARRRLRWAGARLVQLAAGVAWWAAMTVALAFATISETDDRAILYALVIGGFAQIRVASLAYLGPVLRGGGHERLTAGFAITRSWVSLGAGNAAALAALVGHGTTLAAALAIWLTDIAIRARRLLTTTRSNDHV